MSTLHSLLWLASGAVLLSVSTRTSVAPIAIWLSLAAFLRGFRALPAVPGLPATALAFYVALAVALRGIVPAPGPAYFAVVAGIALGMTVPFAVDRWLAPNLPGWTTTLVFPMAWVTVEFLNARLGPYGTNGSIAYLQAGDLPLMQLAAFTGLWGITFAVAWFASIVNWAWAQQFAWDRIGTGVTVYASCLAFVLLAGSLRLARQAAPHHGMRVAVVSFPRDMFPPGEVTSLYEGLIGEPERAVVRARLAALQDWFIDGTIREARAGARLVAWPEMNLIVLKEDEDAFAARAARVAQDTGTYIAMGLAAVEPDGHPPTENKIVLLAPSGRTLISYLKSRPVPGWEAATIRRGDGRLPVADTADGRIGAAICFENDFPEFVARIGQAGADLWIMPANDWEAIKRSHFDMAAFRAIENGTPVLRAASSGVSGAFDPYGRVIAYTDHFSGARTMVAQVPVGHLRTVYSRIGDLFAWICIAGLAVAAVVSRWRPQVP